MQHKNEQVILTLEKFIKQWIDENGMSPTVREISDGTGIPKSTVSRYLAYMREHGMHCKCGVTIEQEYVKIEAKK